MTMTWGAALSCTTSSTIRFAESMSLMAWHNYARAVEPSRNLLTERCVHAALACHHHPKLQCYFNAYYVLRYLRGTCGWFETSFPLTERIIWPISTPARAATLLGSSEVTCATEA